MYKTREFLVKWAGKSYWECSWVQEIRVSEVRSPELMHSLALLSWMSINKPPSVTT